MKRRRSLHRVVCVVGLVVVASGAFAADTGCQCDRGEILDQIRAAETIFYGRIVEAQMESAASEYVQLIVEAKEPIRGPQSRRVSITTTLPHKCGIPAEIGKHGLYVIPDLDRPVTRCSGSSAWHEFDLFYDLGCALITISYADSDPSIVKNWLQRCYRGRPKRDDLQDYFALLEELDPFTTVIYTDKEVIYGNLVFVFSEDELMSYFWR